MRASKRLPSDTFLSRCMAAVGRQMFHGGMAAQFKVHRIASSILLLIYFIVHIAWPCRAIANENMPRESAESDIQPQAGSGSVMSSSEFSRSSFSDFSSSSVSFSYSVVINEVFWMGSDLSTADEWVELAAISEDASAAGLPASLSGWTLVSVKDGVESPVIRFSHNHALPIGGYGVVSNYPEGQSRLSIAPLAVSTGMSLANTKLLLRLYDDLGVLRDEADDGIGNPFAGTNTSSVKASMERISTGMPGNVSTNWKTAQASSGFDAVPFVLSGTPGYANGAASPASSSFSSSTSSVPISSSAPSSVVSSSSQTSDQPLTVRISEVMPDPVGSDDFEWVELLNAGTGSVSTAGMTVAMSGGTVRQLPVVDIPPGRALLLPKEQTHLTLPNAGGIVVLMKGTLLLDSLSYPALPEGVGFGPDASGVPRALCLPTPGETNTSSGSQVAIDVQSGMPVGETVTLNLSVKAVAGSLEGGVCRWEYPDGYGSDSCNPPSHAIDAYGAGNVTLQFTDYCGNTMLHTLPVFISRKPKRIIEDEKNGIAGFSCTPSAFTGALITEFFPNPDGDEEEGEWIEVKNVSGHALPLCGWAIEDAAGKRYDLKKLRMPEGDAFVFGRKQTGITLNNDADAVRLIAPDPYGGSGTVLQEVAFDHAPAARTYALREDGVWLWTPLPTPGTANDFPSVVLPEGPAKARLRAAMPNPKGSDEGVEWVEIENLTGRPLWMQKWTLRADTDTSLSGKAIHPHASRRFAATELGVTLRNSDGALRLFDDRGMEFEPLVWQTAKDDQVVTPAELKHAGSGTVTGIRSDGTIDVLREDGASHLFALHGVAIENPLKKDCNDSISALIKNKKSELYFYSNVMDSGRLMIDGYDPVATLLKSGCAYRSHLSTDGIGLGYDLFEQDAKDQRRGIWASAENGAAVAHIQSEEDTRRIVSEQGIILTPSIREDLVDSGAVLSFDTNVPAAVYVSINASPFSLFGTGAVLAADASVQAYAEWRMGSGTIVMSDVFDHAYILRKESYDRSFLLSEIYPSPKKGEAEWLELHNAGDTTVNLAGWQIDDGLDEGSRPFLLGSAYAIQPDSFLLLRNIKVAWNNGGDTIRLIAPDGTVVDSWIYPKVKTGFAVAVPTSGDRMAAWCLTETPTPLLSNNCYLSPKKSKNKNSTSALMKNKKSSSENRKILYKNIVQLGGVEGVFAELEGNVFHSMLRMSFEPSPFRNILVSLLVIYCLLMMLFARFRRY